MSDRSQSLPRMIRQRARLLRELRAWFDDRDFFEVQPPCLSRECIVDLHIDPIAVSSEQFGLLDGLPDRYFLQTSPEAAMKRMLADGAPSIYSLGPTFRGGERGEHHNVEFTMLEWYQLHADLDQGITLLGELAADILDRDGFDVVCYRQLFRDRVGCDPLEVDIRTLQSQLATTDQQLADSLTDDHDGLLEAIWSFAIQPGLGSGVPVIVKNYPLSQAALARVAEDDPQCAARFELFVDGVELANGYHELDDAEELCRRLEQANRDRVRSGSSALPLPEQFLLAMQSGLPPCAGVALGVDRLLMVRTANASLDHVLPFPIELA